MKQKYQGFWQHQKFKTILISLCLLFAFSGVSWGQVNMTTTSSYSQDFNTLANSGSNNTWTDNSTISSWYWQTESSSTGYNASTGSSNSGKRYSFGATSSSDRAMGSIGSGSPDDIAWGVLLRNTSGVTISDIKISYRGEQWRYSGTSSSQTVQLHYKISSSIISDLEPDNNSGWISVSSLDFTSPITSGSTGALDGNNSSNSEEFNNISIPSLSLADNEYIMIRWRDVNHSGSDHGLSIDDVTISWTAVVSTNDNDSEIGDPTTQVTADNISSLDDTQAEAKEVFKFDVIDSGSGDGLATKITQVTIQTGTNNNLDWTTHIEGVRLSTDGGSTFVTTGTATINSSSIVIPITAGDLDISDNGGITVSLFIYLKNNGLTDGGVFQFEIPATGHGFTADASGSGFINTLSFGDVVSNNFTVDVSATALAFVQQPSDAGVNVAMSPDPTVEAIDVNGNRDTDYSTDISVSSSGMMTGSPVSVAPTSGLATFSGLTHTVAETGRVLTASSVSFTNVNSNTFDVNNTPSTINSEDFSNCASLTWTAVDVDGSTDVWSCGSGEMAINGFGDQNDEDWLIISTPINLSNYSNEEMTFDTQERFNGPDLELYYSTDFSGTFDASSVNAATWTQISHTFNDASSNSSLSSVFNNTVDLSSITGNVYIAFKYTGTSSLAEDWRIDNIEITGIALPTGTSDIIENTSFSYTENIDYTMYDNITDITDANSLAVAAFTIRDGAGSTDADSEATTLTDITFNISNHENIDRIAIYDGTTELGEVEVTSNTISFSSLSLVAADGGNKTFTLRAVFETTVTDNEQFQFTINAVTGTGSGFVSGDGGAATSSTTGDRNRIEVTASALAFVEQPSNTGVNVAMSPDPTVAAVDANGNRDLDYNTAISVTSSGAMTGTPVSGTWAAGLATFASLTHTVVGTGIELTANSATFNVTSNTFDINNLPTSIAYQGFEADPATPADTWNYSGGTTSESSTISHSGSRSLRIEAAGTTTFDNIDITNYESAELSVAFAANNVDTNEDLFLGVSYDNGSTWNETQLVDASSNFDLNFGQTEARTVASNPYTVSIADSENQIQVRFRVTGLGGSSEYYYIDEVQLEGILLATGTSDIVENTSFTYPENIAYTMYDNITDITDANSLAVAEFTIQDGSGSADTDTDATTLTDITFDIANHTGLDRVAIYDGTTELGEVEVTSNTITFSSLSLVAADGGNKTFTVRAVFETTATDNEQFQFTISNVTGTGSGFATINGGGATSSITGDRNRIEVTATNLVFTNTFPMNVNTGGNFSLTVNAVDANNNIDLDNTASVTITKASGPGILSGGTAQSLASGTFTFNALQLDTDGTYTLEAGTGSLTNVTSGNITASPSLTDEYRSAGTGNWSAIGSWEVFNGSIWVVAGAVPDATNETITIQNGHTITIDGDITVDQLVVESGATLVRTSGDITLEDGTGEDFIINGTYQENASTSLTLPLGDGTMLVNSGGVLEVSTSNPGNFDDYASNQTPAFASRITWSDGAIFYWNVTTTFSASGRTYFPNVTGTDIPIFRIGKSVSNIGGNSETVINGKVEIEAGANNEWQGTADKTFKYGVIGAGTLQKTVTSGVIKITGAGAELSIANLNLVTGLEIDNNDIITMNSNVTVLNGTITLTSGDLNLNNNNLLLGDDGEVVEDIANGHLIKDETATTESNKGGYVEATNRTIDDNPKNVAGLGVVLNRTAGSDYNVSVKRYHFSAGGGGGIKRIFDITSSVATIPATTIRINYSDDELDGLAEPLHISRWSSADGWDSYAPDDSDDASSINYVERQGITTFSHWTASDANSPLPVELLSFEGESIGKEQARLSWQTASEKDNLGFEVEKSLNGRDFETLTFVEGAGTYAGILAYDFTDHAFTQSAYYRLKQIDFEGSFEYSNMIFVENTEAREVEINVYPNPFVDHLSIDVRGVDTQDLAISLLNYQGKVIFSYEGNLVDINRRINARLTDLKKGFYILRIQNEDNTWIERLIKR